MTITLSGKRPSAVRGRRQRGDGRKYGNVVKFVQEEHGINRLACMCAIDRATLIPLCEYWAPGVEVTGIHEMVANALIVEGQHERETDLWGKPLKEEEAQEDV